MMIFVFDVLLWDTSEVTSKSQILLKRDIGDLSVISEVSHNKHNNKYIVLSTEA